MEEAEKRRGIRNFLIVLIVVVLVGIVGSVLFFLNSPGQNPIKDIAKKIGIGGSDQSENPDSSDPDTTDFGASSSSGSGGGGGEGGGSSSGGGEGGEGTGIINESTGCYIRMISHSLENINTLEECNGYDEDICIDKTITCSAYLRNRDNTLAGNFKVELAFIPERAGKNESLDIRVRDFFLEPQGTTHLEEAIRINSIGEEGVANKQINCIYNIIEVPTEEVCV